MRMKAGLVTSRGKYKRISLLILCDETKTMIVYEFYDTHLFSFTNEMLTLHKISELSLYEDQTIFLLDNQIRKKFIKVVCNNLSLDKKNDDFYTKQALSLFAEIDYKLERRNLPKRLNISEKVSPNMIREIFLLYFSETLNLSDIFIRYPLICPEKLKHRAAIIDFFMKNGIHQKLKNIFRESDFKNTKNPEEILSKISRFIQLFEIVNKLDVSNIKSTEMDPSVKKEILDIFSLDVYSPPDFFQIEFPHIKDSAVPLLEEMRNVDSNLDLSINNESIKYQASFHSTYLKINKKLFDTSPTSLYFVNENRAEKAVNYEEFKENVFIIKENKNAITFTTAFLKEIILKKQMIKTQKKEIIGEFLKVNLVLQDSLSFSFKNLAKLEKIMNYTELANMSKKEGFILQKSENLLVKNSSPIFSSPKLCTHILTGNNMSGKSTYLKYIITIIIISQIGIKLPFEVLSPIFTSILFIKSQIHDDTSALSSLESELIDLKNLIEIIEKPEKQKFLIIIDEFGKSANFSEATALASLLVKRIYKCRNFHCFFATHDMNLLNYCRLQIRHVNFIQSCDFKVVSGIAKQESIAHKFIDVSVDIENREMDNAGKESQFAYMLENKDSCDVEGIN